MDLIFLRFCGFLGTSPLAAVFLLSFQINACIFLVIVVSS